MSSRPNPILYVIFLAALIAVLGGVAVTKGGFYIAKHEGDTLHLLQIVFRMADGELPHLDFMTPIGIFSFWPIVLFLQQGFGVGQAILWSQILVAAVLLAPTAWVALTRFNGYLAYGFGLVVMVLTLALVHGQTDQLVSVSMHYNRWAWALAYIIIIAAVLPPRAGGHSVDGAIIGIGMTVLALAKMTYFVAFLPGVFAALLLRKAWKTLGVGVATGLAAAALMTAYAGFDFWLAYASDLITVATTDVRPAPGMPLQLVIGAPIYLGGSLVLFLGIVLLRQAGQDALGASLLLLAPGFFYVTYQNSGNDPQWLPLLALLLLWPAVDPERKNGLGWPLGRALGFAAVAAIAFGAGSFLNVAYSPFRHMTVNEAKYQPLIPSLAGHTDLQVRKVRANRLDSSQALDEPGSGLEYLHELADRERTATEFGGRVWPQCELVLGLTAFFELITQELESTGLTDGKRIYAGDLFSSYWLYGATERLEGGTPWYYGGLPGWESADYLMVPLCPSSTDIRKLILETIAEKGGRTYTEVHAGPMLVLYELGPVGSAEGQVGG